MTEPETMQAELNISCINTESRLCRPGSECMEEIIKFPILKLDGQTMEIDYIQPIVHPQLTPFRPELTGVIQAVVDGLPSLQQVLERVIQTSSQFLSLAETGIESPAPGPVPVLGFASGRLLQAVD